MSGTDLVIRGAPGVHGPEIMALAFHVPQDLAQPDPVSTYLRKYRIILLTPMLNTSWVFFPCQEVYSVHVQDRLVNRQYDYLCICTSLR